MRQNRRSGFTLIELLVVVAIIAVLVAILLPSLQRARESAQSATCASQEKQMGLALRMYLDDNNETYPVAFKKHDTGDADQGYTWREAIYDHLGMGRFSSLGSVLSPASQSVTIYTCPSDSEYPSYELTPKRASYAANRHYIKSTGIVDGVMERDDATDPDYQSQRYRKESYVSDPVGTFVVVDSCPPFKTYGWRNANNSYVMEVYWGDFVYLTFPHNGGNNYLFCDGHVEGILIEETCSNLQDITDGIWTPWAD